MKIKKISWKKVSFPLKTPFKTALRTLSELEVIQLVITADSGLCGTGGCAPTAAITGETMGSLNAALEHISAVITGMDCSALEPVVHAVQTSMAGNTSAKSAVDIALYDLYTKNTGIPLYNYLGGTGESFSTDLTISLNSPRTMAADALAWYKQGVGEFKLKVGGGRADDIERILAVREAVGDKAVIRLDANQGWSARDAVSIVNEAQRQGARIDFVEQPVKAGDLRGMRRVRENIDIPLVADESVFTAADALRLIENEAADGINIKLAKCGGISQAVKIAAIAETAGLFCMLGCMMESHAGVSAAAHLASALRVVEYADLDVPLLCRDTPESGGAVYEGTRISLLNRPGLGIEI